MSVSRAILEEIAKNAEKIDNIRYGKVTFVIQDGYVLRVIVEDAWLVEKGKETE